MNTILIFQGGGVYGAYECGVYQALAPRLDNLHVVGGTSVGAINASLIAVNYRTADRGVMRLTEFWQNVLAQPSFPFFPFFPSEVWRRWNAVWTSLLWGNRHLFRPRPLIAPIFWSSRYFYSSDAMERTLEEEFGTYAQHNEPRLIVTAVDIVTGEPKSFDSQDGPVTAKQVLACCSLPPLLPETAVDQQVYWDGGLWSNTPLVQIIQALKKRNHHEQQPGVAHVPEKPEKYQIYIIGVWPKQGRVPQGLWETLQRMNEILYGDKTQYDKQATGWVSRYLAFVWAMAEAARSLPASDEFRPLKERIDAEYLRCSQEHLIEVDITYIDREPLPYERISREIDFSRERIDQLIQQGYKRASVILDAHMIDRR